jgi:uncharacterized iron-regulated protein
MGKRSIIAAASLLLAVLTVLIAGMMHQNEVLRVSDKSIITFNDMMRDLKMVNIVFIGEVHSIPEHHRMELEVIRAFHESDRPLAIGLEMFRKDSQKDLDSWVDGASSLAQFLPVYYDNWHQPWPRYRDILIYAREHRIPLIGLNIPDAISGTVARHGFDSLSAEQKKHLPPGISCDVDPAYREFIRKAYAEHPQKPDKKFLNFCEAQMVWDKAMAWRLVEFLKKDPGRTVVVLAGVGHAWKRGIPGHVARLSPFTSRVIIPFIPDEIGMDSVTTHDGDYVMLQ